MTQSLQAVVVQTPPDCGICQRSLLVGESLRMFHDERTNQTIHVCELCRGRAHKRGMRDTAHDVDSARDERPCLRVQPSGSVADAPDVEAIRAPLQPFPEAVRVAAEPAHSADDVIRELTDRLQRQNRELRRVRSELSADRIATAEQRVNDLDAQLRQLRSALVARDEQITRLQNARIAETSPTRMCAYALDAFNASRFVERMARIARTLGDPHAVVHDCGPGIPRHVDVLLCWDIAWYRFDIKLDLGVGKASVHEVGTGGDPADAGELAQRRANAAWRSSGLVLV